MYRSRRTHSKEALSPWRFRVPDTVDPLMFGSYVPEHVVAIETTDLGTRYHAFLMIQQRIDWIAEDPQHRKAVFAKAQGVLDAWKAFSIVLHPDPRRQRALWRS